MGALAGLVLKSGRLAPHRKALVLAASGVGLTTLGYVLGGWYPLIQKAWPATFDIYAAGLPPILLALFYLAIDVAGFRKWPFFFRVIGMNSIAIYLGTRMIDFGYTSKFWFGGLARLSGDAGPLVLLAGTIAVEWLVLYFLYKKKVFLRV
jgi:predicted acyltransferase